MMEKTKRIQAKREAYRKGLPQIKLETCRLEQNKDTKMHRFIIEGDPVLLGAVFPNVKIGGLSPIKMMSSADRKVAVGLVRGTIKNQNTIIDYGFTKDSCKIVDTAFSQSDAKRYRQITKPLIRKVKKPGLWNKIARLFRSLFKANKK